MLVADKRPGPERDLAGLGRALWSELGERFPAARVAAKGALLIDASGGDGVSDLEPALAPGTSVIHEPKDLQVDAAGLAAALAAQLPCRCGENVARVEHQAVILSSGERLHCDHVVVATGAWAAELTPLPVRPRKGQLVALAAPPNLIRHKLIEASYREAAAGASPKLAIASVIEQTLDGDEVLVGSSRQSVGFDSAVRDEVTHAMLARATRFVPALRELPVRRAWCGFRPWLPDSLPAIGAWGEGLWTTTGHEGSGVGLGPISGRLLAQLITGEPPLYDPAPFDPRRFLN